MVKKKENMEEKEVLFVEQQWKRKDEVVREANVGVMLVLWRALSGFKTREEQ